MLPLVPPSEALRINYVYLKTPGSLAARPVETGAPRSATSGALRNWNATHSGSDCNVTCNVEHIQRYTFRYSENLRLPWCPPQRVRSRRVGHSEQTKFV